jgi:glycosyltransferase involved in cell wall biosynthesis
MELPHRPTVLMVGATEPHKRHLLGIEAVRRMRARTGLNVTLTLIGPEGSAEADIRTVMRENISWIVRETNLTGDELQARYRSASVLLQPSRAEGYGLPVAEACAWSLPVVHSGEGALSEIAPCAAVENSSEPESYEEALLPLMVDRDRYRASSADAARACDAISRRSFRRKLTGALAVALR